MSIKTNLVIDQGTSFFITMNVMDDNGDPIDLSGYNTASQIRKWYTSSNSVSFTVSSGPNTGILSLSLTPAQTGNLSAGRYVYDIELTSNSTGAVYRVVEGIVTVTPQVTR